MARPSCRLYLITPPRIDAEVFADALAAALDAGDVACVQLRLKDVEDDTVLAAAERLLPVVQDRNAALLINDRPDLAAKAGADGTHVGQEDASYADARALLGKNAIVGVTCHASRQLAMEAADGGADYVAFGAFFPTPTKTPKASADPEIVQWWHDIATVPQVAIGGITPGNCAPLVEAGADFLAVVSAVWDHADGPARAVEDFMAAIKQAGGG